MGQETRLRHNLNKAVLFRFPSKVTPPSVLWIPSPLTFSWMSLLQLSSLSCNVNFSPYGLGVFFFFFVGDHFKVMSNSCDPMDCSLPGSSVHGILQARILDWVAIPSSSASSWPRGWTQVSCIARRFFTNWAMSLFNLLQYCFCWMCWFFGPEAPGLGAPLEHQQSPLTILNVCKHALVSYDFDKIRF